MRSAPLCLLLVASGLACRDDRSQQKAAPAGPSSAQQATRAVVDVHTHFGPDAAPRMLRLMDQFGIQTVVNLSGGIPGRGLEAQLSAARAAGGRIIVFTNLDWSEPLRGPGYGLRMATTLRTSHQLGARGVKIPKALGLGFTDHRGQLIAVDEPELDPVFETAGELGLPVSIHTGDPVAFWLPASPGNERLAELSVHPNWSFYGQPVPPWEDLFAALERRIARHPRTTFISVHFGNAPEYPRRVAELLDRYPNLYIDTAARVPEIGRQPPAELREIFIAHADRILFGTDLGVGTHPQDLMLGSTGAEPPTAADVEHFFTSTWRFFETADRDFAHPTPIQGNWTISGIDLPDVVLDRFYRDNATSLLKLSAPARPAP